MTSSKPTKRLTKISVQRQGFNFNEQMTDLEQGNVKDGATVTFTGRVRDFNDDSHVTHLEIEHYPGMTQMCLKNIAEQARKRWSLGHIVIIHRYGKLALGDNIVFVGVTSMHRKSAFMATEFIMDYLKTKAPFWKKEGTKQGERWVEAKQSDQQEAHKW
ncbi:molybdopterin synthase catalytic subunit MoaE [Thalassotalea aquiviva]|uniref:molybdopterin synthase catalytic subunit MoaE n=1 Tax=Thalassotalea aquiviva TaxID=3242415 RepID=UPI003529E66A